MLAFGLGLMILGALLEWAESTDVDLNAIYERRAFRREGWRP